MWPLMPDFLTGIFINRNKNYITGMYKFKFSHEDKVPIFKQIANSVIRDIEKGVINQDFHLPSINEVNEQYSIARDTIERAYKELKQQGYIIGVAAKGYYVTGKKDGRLKILLVFNKLSSFKRIIYDSLLQHWGKKQRWICRFITMIQNF
jgi:DNA-binding transcriptional regulator YhcF (GntR family)